MVVAERLRYKSQGDSEGQGACELVKSPPSLEVGLTEAANCCMDLLVHKNAQVRAESAQLLQLLHRNNIIGDLQRLRISSPVRARLNNVLGVSSGPVSSTGGGRHVTVDTPA